MGSKAAKRIFQTGSLEQWKHGGVQIAKQPGSNKNASHKMRVLVPATLLAAVSSC